MPRATGLKPFVARLRASTGRAAVEAFVAGAVTDHDRAAVAAAGGVLLVEERALFDGVGLVGVFGRDHEADHFPRLGGDCGWREWGGGGGDPVDEGIVASGGRGDVGRRRL